MRTTAKASTDGVPLFAAIGLLFFISQPCLLHINSNLIIQKQHY
jgi:hypothetical protein